MTILKISKAFGCQKVKTWYGKKKEHDELHQECWNINSKTGYIFLTCIPRMQNSHARNIFECINGKSMHSVFHIRCKISRGHDTHFLQTKFNPLVIDYSQHKKSNLQGKISLPRMGNFGNCIDYVVFAYYHSHSKIKFSLRFCKPSKILY